MSDDSDELPMHTDALRIGPLILATGEERQAVRHLLQAACSIYGCIIFWVGGWCLLVVCCGSDEWFPNQVLWYAAAGVALSVWLDIWYAAASMDDRWRAPITMETRGGPMLQGCRVALGLLASVTLDVGVFQTLNFWFGLNTDNEWGFAVADDDATPTGHYGHTWRDFHRLCVNGWGYNPNEAIQQIWICVGSGRPDPSLPYEATS